MTDELLMIPGPTNIANSVLREMSSKTVAHYGEDWTNFYNETRNMLKDVFETQDDILLFVGSGHASIDAALGSILEDNDEVLVLSNGIFGDKLVEISRLHKAKVTKIESEWGKTFDLNEIDKELKHNDYKAILMVDVETSTGVRNPIKKICQIAKKYNLITFVDAVCSLGIEELRKDDWNIDICVSASQKGLAAPPGLSIICCNDKIWEKIDNRKTAIRGWYLNMKKMREFEIKQKNYQPYGITMAVHNVMALNKSLKLIKEEGKSNRIKRHENIANLFRKNIRELGLVTLCEDDIASNAVTTIECPLDYNSNELIEIFKNEYNIIIGKGLGELENDYVRVGHMNQGASKVSIYSVIKTFEEILKKGV